MNKGILICAGESNADSLAFFTKKLNKCYIIAADGGIEVCKAAGLVPDLMIGDFDSLRESPYYYFPKEDYPYIELVKLPCEKDDTDTIAAIRAAADKGIDELYIFGGTGGRMDHYIANIQTLLFAKNLGIDAYLLGESKSKAFVIKNEEVRFDASYKGVISVFCLGAGAKGVDISGLKYEVAGGELSSDFPVGVSNEFIGKEAIISVKDGALLIFINNAPCF
ncbi:MAG: thiamine diphosphokinase [Lachnospiraceae bacterium]|nr:thiamine diphosphokinase [Lachnospiraceae bacterium]